MFSCIFTVWSTGTIFFFLVNYYKVLSFGVYWMIHLYNKIPWWVNWPNTQVFIYLLSVWSYFNHLHSSQWITFPTQSFWVLYSFCRFAYCGIFSFNLITTQSALILLCVIKFYFDMIIIKSQRKQWFSWLSLSIRLSHPSLPADLLN